MVWEDHRLLDETFAPMAHERILSVGAAGCNALNLLLRQSAKIVAVDINPYQIALLRLKIEAIRRLEPSEFLQLLGYQTFQPENSQRLFKSLKTHLQNADWELLKKYFDPTSPAVCESGKLESYFGLFRSCSLRNLWSPELLSKLQEGPDLEEQNQLLLEFGKFEKLEFEIKKWFGRLGLEKARDPSQMAHVTEVDPAEILWQRFRNALQSQKISENPYLHYFLFGDPSIFCQHIPYLKPENFFRLRSSLERIEVASGNLLTIIESEKFGRFDHFNLSDIFEYMDPTSAQHAMNLIHEHSSPEAVISFWNLFLERKPETDLWQSTPSKSSDWLWFYRSFQSYRKRNLQLQKPKSEQAR